MKSPPIRVLVVLLLYVPLLGCIGWGDMFAPKRSIAGDYFLMKGNENTTQDLYLFSGDNTNSVTGRLHRVGWDQQYIVYTDDNNPVEWNVVMVKEHKRSTISEIQRTQDFRFKQIAIGSASEAWEWRKSKHSRYLQFLINAFAGSGVRRKNHLSGNATYQACESVRAPDDPR